MSSPLPAPASTTWGSRIWWVVTALADLVTPWGVFPGFLLGSCCPKGRLEGMLAALLRQECLVVLVPPCLGQLHMRYPDSLQRQEGFRSPSRRLVCVNSAIHTGRPPLGFACLGRKVISSLLDSKEEWVESIVPSLNSASLVAVASHISQLQRHSNTGLKLYRISEELRGPIEPILLECKFIGGNQYLVFVPKILLSQVLHASTLDCSHPLWSLHSLNSKKYIHYLLPTKHFIIYPPVLAFVTLLTQ